MSRSVTFLRTSLLALLVAAPTVARATDLAACGHTVQPGDTGVLVADLDCGGFQYGVRLLRGATLDLNGHTITGGTFTVATVLAVASSSGDILRGGVKLPLGSGPGDATIRGPGAILGTPNIPGCVVLNRGDATVTSASGTVEISGCDVGILGWTGSHPNRGQVTIDHAEIHGTLSAGMAARHITATSVDLHEAGGIALSATGRLVLDTVSIVNNDGNGAYGHRVTGREVTASGNFLAVYGVNSIDLRDVTLTGNHIGVYAKRITLADSIVTGNSYGDIGTNNRPRLTNVVCDYSYGSATGSWGVCAFD